MYVVNEELEKKEIIKRYRQLISVFQKEISQEEKRMIRKAFTIASKAHSGMRRHSGEPYIFHPLEVARIAAQEVGMGPIAVVCALLHDVVEDTEYTLDDIRTIFNDTVAVIIDGLTKIGEIMGSKDIESLQAENYKKLVMAMADDVRVILIKLCDRLHNMRTLDAMPRNKQLAISSETMFLYVPLAHRLGLYLIKSELEELSMKYTHTKEYNDIKSKLEITQGDREAYIDDFIDPIKKELTSKGFKYNITGRIKSIPSIWQKMKDKQIEFEEVYDVFAIRIILDTPLKTEKEDCFKVYSLISGMYHPSPERFRDWVSSPKTNGYEAIHTTVMGKGGRWVEVQIRSKRMNEIAEKGLAAHYRYKERNQETPEMESYDNWIEQVREIIEHASNAGALEFVDDFKLNLYSDVITAFTPKGEMLTLPKGSCVLDFAFSVHTQLGLSCMGAKVNYQVVANNYIIKNGDQIQILTSKKTEPKEEWISWVKTLKAKEELTNVIREKRKTFKDSGREKILKHFKTLHIDPSNSNILRLKKYLKLSSDTDLYYQAATNKIDVEKIRACFNKNEKPSPWMIFLKGVMPIMPFKKTSNLRDELKVQVSTDLNSIFWDEKDEKLKSKVAQCCNPIPGDDVVGLVSDDVIVVHRTNCNTAIEEMSKFKKRIVKAKWRPNEDLTFLCGIKISGIDRKGLLQDMVKVVTNNSNLNIRGLTMEVSEGVVSGMLMIYIINTAKLKDLTTNLLKIEGVELVERV